MVTVAEQPGKKFREGFSFSSFKTSALLSYLLREKMDAQPMHELKLPTPMGSAQRESKQRRRRWLYLSHFFRYGHGSLLASLGIATMLLIVFLCLAAPLTATHDPTAVDLRTGLQAPSAANWLGTDQLGRDVWSRVVWAGRASLLVTGVVLVFSLGIGLMLGLLSGYGGGWVDNVIMRITDFFYALPQIILALALIGAVGPSIPALMVTLTIGGWVSYARLTRSLVLALSQSDFVTAARATGATDRRILTHHLLPGAIGPVSVQLSLDAGSTILAVAALSFLGLGIQPPTPEWGTMLVEARPYLNQALHLVLPPGLAIFLVVFGCNTLGEALENRLRPAS
ncbi:MAG: ABC transporter permease [Chloroflexota bacterium]